MHFNSIKKHLKPYKIYYSRSTTINHAFASAVAPSDVFDKDRIIDAIRMLGQDPDEPLKCAYCYAEAETWDHIFAIVKDSEFSGHGHRLGNLLPCCKSCNSNKGNSNWLEYLNKAERFSKVSEPNLEEKIKLIESYLLKYSIRDNFLENSAEMKDLRKIKDKVLDLLRQADSLAEAIRKKALRPMEADSDIPSSDVS